MASSTRIHELSWKELARLVWPGYGTTPLVAFGLDDDNRLIGRVAHPQATPDATELRSYLLLLARECDRFQHLLSGRDAY